LPLVPRPNQLNEATMVSSLPSSSPARPFIVVYVTAATVTIATTASLPRPFCAIEQHLNAITADLIVSAQLAADTVTAVAAAFTTTACQLFTIQFATAKATTAASDDVTMTTHQIFTIPSHAAMLLLLQLPKLLLTHMLFAIHLSTTKGTTAADIDTTATALLLLTILVATAYALPNC
jgi:hypothetical protein